MSKLDRFIRNLPRMYKAGINPVVTALLSTWAEADDEIVTQLQNTKAQLFVRTAEGKFLDRLASSKGVARPTDLGLANSKFQELIPVLSLHAKQIRKVFFEALDVFYGPYFTRTNITSTNSEPFNVSAGDIIYIKIDGGETQEIEAEISDIAVNGAATAQELVDMLNLKGENLTATVITEPDGDKKINIRTDTPGPVGTLEFLSSTMLDPTKLDFEIKKYRITDVELRATIYQIDQRELTIELPIVVPALNRSLLGSHHFHADPTLESPVPPANGIWAGSFFFDPNGVPYTVTSKKAILNQTILAGQPVPSLSVIGVIGAENIDNARGYLIFSWGRGALEEQPVGYISRPNDNTLRLDPSYIFQKNHTAGEPINMLLPVLAGYEPKNNGQDLAIYLPSPIAARQIIENILELLVAVGVVVNFVVTIPDISYICSNPYEG